MYELISIDRPIGRDARRVPNVAGVGAWLATVKILRRELADYVPRHRAPGPAA